MHTTPRPDDDYISLYVKRTLDDLVTIEPASGITVSVGFPEIIVVFFPILFRIEWDVHFVFFFFHQTAQLGSCKILIDIGAKSNRCREMAFVYIDRCMYDGVCDDRFLSLFLFFMNGPPC